MHRAIVSFFKFGWRQIVCKRIHIIDIIYSHMLENITLQILPLNMYIKLIYIIQDKFDSFLTKLEINFSHHLSNIIF